MFENPDEEKLQNIKRILKHSLGSIADKLFKGMMNSDADMRLILEKVQDFNPYSFDQNSA